MLQSKIHIILCMFNIACLQIMYVVCMEMSERSNGIVYHSGSMCLGIVFINLNARYSLFFITFNCL